MIRRSPTPRRWMIAAIPLAPVLFVPILLAWAIQSAAAQVSSVPVQAAVATRQDAPVELRNIGAVQAYQAVLVRARVDGTLEKVMFREGQDVNVGDQLALIDPRPYAAALAQAQAKKAADLAQLINAQHDLVRYTNLAHSDFASRQQLDTQTSTVAQDQAIVAGDEAAIDTARLNLEFCTITSPITGRVGLRLVDAGNLIHATDVQGIVSIMQIHPIAVIFTLPQDYAATGADGDGAGRADGARLHLRRSHQAGRGRAADPRQHHRPDHRHDQDEGRIP